jgi:hypothetical protein
MRAIGRLLVVACAGLCAAATGQLRAGEAAGGRVVLYPAEQVAMDYSKRCLVRFDLSRLKNAKALTSATLIWVGTAPAGAFEVRPVATQWGGACEEFAKRAERGVWTEEDLKRDGYKVAAEMWLIGDPDGTWASREAKKWKAAGGDYGEVAATLKQMGGIWQADISALAKSWAAEPEKNFGILLSANLAGAPPRLVLEGQGLALDDEPRLDAPPSWLPKTYRAVHPRLPYPSKEWLEALKADPRRLAELCMRADSFEPANGPARLLPDLALAQRLAPTPERAEKLSAAVDAPFPNHGGFAVCYGLAVLYDWGYDLLAPDARRRLASRLERMCTGEELGCEDTTISPYNDVGTSRFGCGLLWAALAIYPDVPASAKHLWRAKSYYIDTSLPVWHQILGDDGGYWHETHGYYLSDCIGNAMGRVLSSWTSAAGQDLYKENPWLENMLYYHMYSTRPDMYRLRLGDIKCGYENYGEEPIWLYTSGSLIAHYDNPYGRWWGQYVGGVKADGITPTEWPWGPPVAKDAKTKTWDSLPTVRYSDGVGVVNLRSDWSEDATWIWFKCGPSFWSHSHMDCGSFEIYKRGALAVDAGNYSYGYHAEHYCLYGRHSIAHNLITVADPQDKLPKDAPNDGGQRLTSGGYGVTAPYSVAEWKKRAEEYEMGAVLAFQPGRDFTYVCGDLTKAYTNSKSGTGDTSARSKRVRKMLRSLVYLPPDHLLVFDQVESFNKDFKKRWLLHTIEEPRTEGNLTAVERAGQAFRFTAWDKRLKNAITATAGHAFFKEHPDCKFYNGYQPQLYQYDGVMFVRTLLPENAEIVKVGGDGKECWLDGVNHDGAEGSEVGAKGKKVGFRPYTGEGEAGRWRLEVSPAAPAENDLFLHVIQVGLKSKDAKPAAAKLVKAEGATGAEVELGNGRKATVTFKPGVGGHIKIEGGGQAAVEADLAEKVLPNIKIEK